MGRLRAHARQRPHHQLCWFVNSALRIAALSVVYATDIEIDLVTSLGCALNDLTFAIVETAGFEAIHASDADEAVSRSAPIAIG